MYDGDIVSRFYDKSMTIHEILGGDWGVSKIAVVCWQDGVIVLYNVVIAFCF